VLRGEIPLTVAADQTSLALLARVAIYAVMLSLGLLLGREHVAAALQRRLVLAAIVFAVLVPVPALAVLFVKGVGLTGPMAAGIVLMAISPGAPVALRRTLTAGGRTAFAPALHIAIVLLAVVTVPLSVLILDAIFGAAFAITPLQVAWQVGTAQLLPLGVGVAIRTRLPAFAARLEPPLARASNAVMLAFGLLCVYLFRSQLSAIGWMPAIAGAVLTAGALAAGAACAGRDAAARPQGAIAAAMRNPGLALYIATANQAPPGTVAAVLAYAIGAAIVIAAFMTLRTRSPDQTL
jgi:BASS family bile acid:Na+ symporter